MRRFFLSAYDWARHHGNLPELNGKYQKTGRNRRPDFTIPAATKLTELYEKSTRKKLKNERETGLATVRLLGLLDNLENQQDLNRKERQQYKTLLQFSRTLLKDLGCQEVYLGYEDDE